MKNFKLAFLLICLFSIILYSEQSPRLSKVNKDCITTTREAGTCKDIHLCQQVLHDISQDFLFPQICEFNSGSTSIQVCCPKKVDQCGVSFPWDDGLESVLDANNIGDYDHHGQSSFRRPPEQEALFDLALQRFGRLYENDNDELGRKKRRRRSSAFPQVFNATEFSNEDDDFNQVPIVNGAEVRRAEYPWTVLLGKYVSSGDKKWFCGGSLISDQWVLSAAHCLIVTVEVVRLGETHLDLNAEDIVDIGVKKTISHPGYNKKRAYNDISLIQLSSPVQFKRNIQPICLPPPKMRLSPRDLLISSGWGHLSFGGRASLELLRTRDLRYVSRRQCRKTYEPLKERIGMPDGVTKTVICAHDKTFNSDPCQGDSGGPLMYYNKRTKVHTLVGVVAAGIGCGSRKFPGIYTDVRDYLDWIHEQTEI